MMSRLAQRGSKEGNKAGVGVMNFIFLETIKKENSVCM
jgi:hypothetical protein